MTSPTEPAQLFEKYQELQRYVGWSDYDVQHVRAAGRVIEPYLPQVIRDFYDEIQRHEDTRVLIRTVSPPAPGPVPGACVH